jgi:DNA-binding NarL/FixJ family response regulator
VDEALTAAESVRGTTRAVEPRVLAAAVEAVSALRNGDARLGERVGDLEEVAFETGAVDLLVTSYRCTPELLSVLFRVTPDRDRLAALVRRAGDADAARAAGHAVDVERDPKARLTPRESEVFELLCQGLTNLQIGKLLYISESTVKRHTLHIYDKLGVRSRTTLAIRAALERGAQATSAMDGAALPEES